MIMGCSATGVPRGQLGGLWGRGGGHWPIDTAGLAPPVWLRRWRNASDVEAQQQALRCVRSYLAHPSFTRHAASADYIILGMRTDHNGWDARVREPALAPYGN